MCCNFIKSLTAEQKEMLREALIEDDKDNQLRYVFICRIYKDEHDEPIIEQEYEIINQPDGKDIVNRLEQLVSIEHCMKGK